MFVSVEREMPVKDIFMWELFAYSAADRNKKGALERYGEI